jgi:glycosyltransferase involved in cell wall biosynthesis
MRIGIVTGEYPPMQGGVGAFSQIIARKFVEQGHEVFVYSGEQAHGSAIPLTNHQGKWGFGSLTAIKQWAEQNRLDVINIQFQTAAFGMSPFIHFLPDYLRNIPVVTTFHDLRFPYMFPKAGKLRDWIVMHLARASTGAIVTNHEDYERVKHLSKATMIPIGSNILTELPLDYDRNAWRTKAGARPDDFLIAFFGFMNRSKGIELLLHSLANLVADAVPAKLVLIGGRTGTSDPTNASYAQEIETLIQKLNLTPHICWTEFVTEAEVSAYLAAADVVALPFLDGASFRRGTLMAAIYHHALIVTTTPQVAIPEFVDGQNMVLVSPNVKELTSTLKNLRKDYSLFRQKIVEGVMTLSKHFDWDNIARDTVAFFERVIHA